MLISIPTFTFDPANYHIRDIDRIKYTAKFANDNITTETSKYTIFNTTKINKPKSRIEYYISRHKKNVLRMYNRQRYKQFVKNNESHYKTQEKYKVTNAIVELVDIFPTIADLAGVPVPICPINYKGLKLNNLTSQKEPNLCSEGITLLPLIRSIVKYQVRYPVI